MTIVECKLRHLEQRAAQRGRTLDQVRPCIVSQAGDRIAVDVDHAAYPKEAKAPRKGPATLASLCCMSNVGKIGVREVGGCGSCGGSTFKLAIYQCTRHGECHKSKREVEGVTACRRCRDLSRCPEGDPDQAWQLDAAGNPGCSCA